LINTIFAFSLTFISIINYVAGKTSHSMKQIFTLIFASFSLIAAAQNNSNAQLRSLTKLNLELQGFSFSAEPKLGKSSTIDFSAGIGTGGYDIWQNSFTYVVNPLNPTGFISITPKFYYNRNKRLAKGKPGELNSGNYIGLRVKYTSRGLSEDTRVWDALLFNAHWGMQRAIGNRWTLNTHFGLGYAIDAVDLSNSAGTVYPALDLKFSYILNKKRS
jgi:hypothetical protein